ncbi:MAG: cyclic nucleotide-binding domain-containing protein [Burkholderiales bacterium]|jgi:CRP-like cAMP-binding protein|nr:cyclic nucleotide-binding domain-containing protein [Burkholderiales bacterium]
MVFGNSWIGDDAREHAARLLVMAPGLVELSPADAREVVGYMRPQRVPSGSVLIREGEATDVDAMMLILQGEVTVEYEVSAPHETMVVSIMGPGGLIGEMGLIDGSPRSATCTATTELAVAVLGRDALRQMIEECPDVAARLLLSISTRLSDHLRESNRKLRTFAQLSRALQQELDATHAVNLRLLGAAAPKT